MLVEDCNQLSQLAQNVIDFRKYASDLEKFRDRQNKIEELVKSLRPLVIALQTFRERELINVDLSQKADLLLTDVVTTLAEFHKDRGWLLEKFKLNTLKFKVDELKNELNRHLHQAWTDYKKRRVPNTNSDLLGLLARIQTFKPTVQRVHSLLAQIDAVDLPKDSNHFHLIDQAIDNLAEAWSSLKSDEVPATVLDFLRAAATHGATIDRLTPEVQDWLSEHGISRFFYIRLSD